MYWRLVLVEIAWVLAYMTAATLGRVYRQDNKTQHLHLWLMCHPSMYTNEWHPYALFAPSVFPAESYQVAVTLKMKFDIHR